MSLTRLRERLGSAVDDAASPEDAAENLCQVCAEDLDVDGASVSFVVGGTPRGTLGASSDMSRELDELQYTFGEGPSLDAVTYNSPVLVDDLTNPLETRWPAFRGAVVNAGVHAVFAMPISVASAQFGALDLFRAGSGPLNEDDVRGGLLAARLAAVPLLELMSPAGEGGSVEVEAGWDHVASLDRVEVFQATGMIMSALDVDATEALVRIRAHAYATGATASAVARAIIDRRLSLDDDSRPESDGGWHR